MWSESQLEKMIVLKSSDGEIFEVEEAEIKVSGTLKLLIEEGCAGDAIPMPNVRGEVLAKVIDWCKKYVEFCKMRVSYGNNPNDERYKNYQKDVYDWGKKFVEADQSLIIELIMAADYLNIQGLLHFTLRLGAKKMKGKTLEEIQATFDIINDFTLEEEEALRKENEWGFK